MFLLPAFAGLSLGILLYQFYENDLTSRSVVLVSSFDYAPFLRTTAIAWVSAPVILLFLHFALLLVGAGSLINRQGKKGEHWISLLPVGFMGLLTGLLLTLIPDLQPFREFGTPMKVGLGSNGSFLHWTRVFLVPFQILSVAFLFPVYLKSAASLIRGGLFSGYNRRDLYWLHSAWFLGILALGLRIVWNYLVGSGKFWVWDPESVAFFSYALFTGSLELSVLPERKNKKPGRILTFLTFHVGLLSFWPLMEGFQKGSGIYLALGVFLHLAIASRNVIFQFPGLPIQDLFSPANRTREGAYRVASLLLLPAGLFTMAGVFVSLLPTGCLLTGNLTGCSPDPVAPDTYAVFLYPLWALGFLFFALLPLLHSEKEQGNRTRNYPLLSLAVAGIGGISAPLIYREFYFPEMRNSGINLALFIPVFFIFTLSVIGSLQEFLFARTDEEDRKMAGLLRLSMTLVFGGVVFSGLGPEKTVTFHYYMMRQFPDSDQVHFYSGDKAYAGGLEIQATDLFLTPVFPEAAYSGSRIKLSVAREAHFTLVHRGEARTGSPRMEGASPYMNANLPFIGDDAFIRQMTGFAPDGKVRSEIVARPVLKPDQAELIRDGAFGEAKRIREKRGDLISTPFRDIQVRLENVESAGPDKYDLDHLFEYFYFDGKKSQEAYYGYFPSSLVATVSFRPVPLAKLVWVGLLILLFLYLNFAWNEWQAIRKESAEKGEGSL